MIRATTLLLLTLFGFGFSAVPAAAEPEGGRRAARFLPVPRGRTTGLAPITSGRAAGLAPITSGRAAGLKPITSGRAAGLAPITSGRAAGLAPITSGRAAGLAPITSGRAANLAPITSGLAAGLMPITSGRAAGLKPITSGRAANLAPITSGRAAGLAPITSGRAANLAPITSGRAAGLAPITSGRAVGLAPITSGRAAGLAPSPARGSRLPISDLIPPDSVPEEFKLKLSDSRFPMVTGDVALKRGEFAKAAVAFDDASRRHPESAGPLFALGDALLGLGKHERAAGTIRKGLAKAPKWADSLARGNADQLKAAAKYAQEHPERGDAWFLLGYLRLTSGIKSERERAETAFSHAVSIDPRDEVSLRYLLRLR